MNRRGRIERQAAVRTVGASLPRDQLGGYLQICPNDSRCKGGTSSTHRLFCGTRELWPLAIEGNDKR